MKTKRKNFFILSLGCPKNEVDSDCIASGMLRAGWTQAYSPREAVLLIVNTCAFIAPAVEESVESILELADLREEGTRRLVVAGCLPSRYGISALEYLLPEVDLFVNVSDYGRLPSLAERLCGEGGSEARGAAGRTVASTLARGFVYLKIAEGCGRACSYCTIPAIKGKLRSRPIESVREEARFFVSMGARELVLVAQDTTSYGRELYGRQRLPDLLTSLCDLEGDFRLRVMYMHPGGLNRSILEAMQDERICRYVDLPLQHADAGVLASMGRGGTEREHAALLSLISETLGEAALRTTFMVGFPGEDERAFRTLYDFMAATRFDWVGLFGYSQEEGTSAFALGAGIPASETRRRLEILAELQEEIMREKAASMVGRTFQVLVEGESPEAPGFWEARSFREAPDVDGVVFVKGGEGLAPGVLREVEITASEGIDLIGETKDSRVGPERGRERG